MTLAEDATLVADITETMHQIYKRETPKAQYTRMGKTTRHFNPRGEVYQGERWHFKAYVGAPHGSRVTTMATARAAAYEFPMGRKLEVTKLSYDYDDLRVLEVTVPLNLWSEEFSKDRVAAIWQAATQLRTEAKLDFGDRANKLVHQDTTVTLAKVADTTLDLDGTSCSSSTIAFVKIDEGSIAMFSRNMAIDIRTAGDSADVRVSGYVKEVCADGLGPWYGGTRSSNFAGTYGIVVQYDATLNTASSGDEVILDNVADGDEIVYHGELDVGMFGLPAWFDPAVNTYFDQSGSAIDRDGGTYGWSIPWIHVHKDGVSGTPTDLDMQGTMQDIADYLPDVVATGRDRRRADQGGGDPKKGIFWRESLLAIGRQDLINDAVTDAEDTIRFTTASALSMSEAEKKSLHGVVGFDGIVYRDPTLGHILMQSDPCCTPEILYILDPNSWFWLHKKGGIGAMNWIPNDSGGVMHTQLGSNGRLTYGKTSGAYTAFLLACDQPKANLKVIYCKSSRKS